MSLHDTLLRVIQQFKVEERRHPIFLKYVSSMERENRRKSAAAKAKPAAGPRVSGKTSPRHCPRSVKSCCVNTDVGAAATRKRKHRSEDHEARPTPPAPQISSPARGTKRKAQDEPLASARSPRRSRRLSDIAPVGPANQPATYQYQPDARTSRGDTPYPRAGYGANEEDEGQGSPGIQDPTALNRPDGDGNRRNPPGGAPPVQNDTSSDSDLSSISEESDWGSDVEPLDDLGDLSDPGFMFVIRNKYYTCNDNDDYAAAGVRDYQKVCLRMTSEDPLGQGWEMANYLTVRGNLYRLKRGMFHLEESGEVECREHLPARLVLDEIARATRRRKFRSPFQLKQATNPEVAWGFEVDPIYGSLTVYGPPKNGYNDLVLRANFFGDALRQDGDRIPRLIHSYSVEDLWGFDGAEDFRWDVLSRFSHEAAEHYGIPRSPQGLQGLHDPEQVDEEHRESSSPSTTTSTTSYQDSPAPSPIPSYTTRPAPWGQVPGPHNPMTGACPPVPENRPGTLPGHYDDGGYTGGQGGVDPGNHTTYSPPQRPQNPNLPFPGGYSGGTVGGVPPRRRLRYTDDPDSGDENEDDRSSRPVPSLIQYLQRDRPATRGALQYRPNTDAQESQGPLRTTPATGLSYYDTCPPTSPNQGYYSPRPRSEDHDSQDNSDASTEILDQNNGDAAPGLHSPVVYQSFGPPATGGEGGQEAGSNSSDPSRENQENIPPFYRFDTVRPPPGPRTPLPVYDPLLQYRDYRPIDSDSDSSDSTMDLRREPHGDDDGSPTLRVQAAIRQNADRTVDNSPEMPPFRRARGMFRRRPRTMSPGTIRETIEHDSEGEDSRPVQRTRHTLSPGALRRRIFEDDLPDLGSPARTVTEDDLPDYESDPYELPPLERGRAPSPGAQGSSAADASPGASPDVNPGPPDSTQGPGALSPREAHNAAGESDSNSDSNFGLTYKSDSGSNSDSLDSSSDSDSARPPRSPDGSPPASPARRPYVEREAQDADAEQSHSTLLEPTPAPARVNEEVIFRDPGWDSPSQEPVDEDVGPRTMSPPVGGGYTHEDAYPHPPPSREDSDNGREEEGWEGHNGEGEGADYSEAGDTYEALLAEEQRLREDYAALIEEQRRQPAGARRMLVSADYYSSPEPEEYPGRGGVAAGT